MKKERKKKNKKKRKLPKIFRKAVFGSLVGVQHYFEYKYFALPLFASLNLLAAVLVELPTTWDGW